jgi:uncharacterized protein (TIGR03435 family)
VGYRLLVVVSALSCISGNAQETVHFEVASVKRVGPSDDASGNYMKGGPGSSDPERIVWRQTLSRALTVAYGVDFDRLSGPKWLATEVYDIQATVPRGSSKEQVREMWKNLLFERFQLKAHTVSRDFPAYQLIVPANGRIRFQRSEEGSYKDQPGFPVLSSTKKWGILAAPPRNVRLALRDSTIDELAQHLAWPLGTLADTGGFTPGRVVNMTGLDGTYDLTLEFAGAWGPNGTILRDLPNGEADTAPPLFDAVRQQLGLQLRETKTKLDVLIVDAISRVPSEN